MKTQKSIMIVEDEALIAADLEQRLIELGYDVPAIADSAASALPLIESHRPDLLLVDIRIHGSVDGIALANHVKQQFKLPVIFLTAHADSSTVQRAKLAEPFGYLVKPVGTASLPSAIEIALYKHKMEQELRRQRSWLETTLHSIGDGVIVADPGRRVRSINDAAIAILETTREAALGRPLDEILPFRYHATGLPVEELATLADAEDHPLPLPAGIYVVTAAGRRAPVEGSIAACRLGDERFGSVVLFRDVAVRQADERERRDEQKMIAVGRLAGGVAGGLHNLQEAIKGCIEALGDGMSASELAAQLREAAGAAAYMSARLRSLVRHKGVELESIGLRQFIESRLFNLRRALPENVVLTARFDDDAVLRAASAQLEGILLNVVANAGEAMSGGGAVCIETSRAKDPRGEGFVRIAVRDTGRGMPPDALENLFEPFYSTQLNGDHKGLGLASAHAAVSMLGGFLAVNSNAAAGTTVEIFLPAANVNAHVEPRWPTVLLVEENEALRHILHNYLESRDYNLLEASGRADALDLAEVFDGAIDLFVADIASADLAAKLRAARPEMKLLFATGNGKDAGAACGAEWIAKPIRKTELLQKVEQMLGG